MPGTGALPCAGHLACAVVTWHVEAMDRAGLLRLADQDLAQAMRLHRRFVGDDGEETERGGLLMVSCNRRFPVGMWNATFPVSAAHDRIQAERWLDQARAFFGERRCGFTVYTGQHRDRLLADACHRAGLHFQRPSPALAITERVQELAIPRLTLKQAKTPAAVADFVQVVGPVYADSGLPRAVTERMFENASQVLATGIAIWIGYVDDEEPVAACWVHTHGEVAGLYWVATLPHYQGRGYGAAVSRRATNVAFDAGARAVVLQASKMGEPIYRRIGFKEISHYHWAFASHE